MVQQPYYSWWGPDLGLQIYLQPRASKDRIMGLHGHYLKVALTAPPLDNRANVSLVRFLAKSFDVAKNTIKIVRGGKSRYKTVLLKKPSPTTMTLIQNHYHNLLGDSL